MNTNVQKTSQLVKQDWTDWLESIQWNYFATFTTPYEMTLKSARRIMGNYHQKIVIPGREDWLFWVAEKYELKDGYHLHALIKTEFPWEERSLWDLWQEVSVCKWQSSNRDDGKVFNRADIQKRDLRKN